MRGATRTAELLLNIATNQRTTAAMRHCQVDSSIRIYYVDCRKRSDLRYKAKTSNIYISPCCQGISIKYGGVFPVSNESPLNGGFFLPGIGDTILLRQNNLLLIHLRVTYILYQVLQTG